MLRHLNALQGFSIQASDGAIGIVSDLLFDDLTWTVRYVTVLPDGWVSSHEVLITPIAIRGIDWTNQRVDTNLTRAQVEHSPSILTDPPVSRQSEAEYFAYYGYPLYWSGGGIWGPGLYPNALLVPPLIDGALQSDDQAKPEETNPHLRSTGEVVGYAIQASDGDIGHIEDFLFDPRSWRLQYLVVDTRNWFPGKKVLIAPSWVEQIEWASREVVVPHTREAIKDAPEFTDDTVVDEHFMQQLDAYYKHG